MHYRSTIARLLALFLLAETAGVRAQVAGDGSPYSAFGFGDLLLTGQVPSALMGGTGIACSEPFSILPSNPASYAAARYLGSEGLVRPTFQGGVRGLFVKQGSQDGSTHRSDAQFMGLSIGVPFGKGKWGLGFGITPFSEVGYSITETGTLEEGTVTYEYQGTGGLNRVFAGLGRVLWQAKPDTSGYLGGRLAVGANFDFVFGSIEQTRNAVYPRAQAYTNTRSFSSLVLRAPAGTFGMHYSNAITSRARAERARTARVAKAQERIDDWRLEHVDETRLSPDELAKWRSARTREERIAWLRDIHWKTAYMDSASMPRLKDIAETRPWRFTLGLAVEPAMNFSATSTDLVTSFFRGSTGVELIVDTLPSSGTVSGTMNIPLAYGAGVSVHNARWLFTVETRRRDWSALKVDIDGYALPTTLRASTTYAFGARFTPGDEGSAFRRATYRAGLRHTDDYLQVKGTPLTTTSVSAGFSLPLNAVQTNSYLHIGAEYGQRGTTTGGLLQETFTNLWVGVSVTPWKRERWFQRTRIQ